MKTKGAVSSKKQAIIVKDLKTRKNPKGGAPSATAPHSINQSRMSANEASASGALKT